VQTILCGARLENVSVLFGCEQGLNKSLDEKSNLMDEELQYFGLVENVKVKDS
jgi:hypothetical protein